MAASIATWPVGKQAVIHCKDKLLAGCSSLDAVEYALSVIEDDKELGLYHVGRGGYPSSNGLMELDAALMDGRDLRFGAVASLRGLSKPSCVARRVMERSRHSMLVGEGAQQFALEEGFTLESNESLLASDAMEQKKKMDKSKASHTCDTLGLIALDNMGDILAGVSTSGLMFKHTGRVGDSPLPGGGLYADNQAGAACATGDGDQIMKFCPTFHAVQLMRDGANPQQACQKVIDSIRLRMSDPNPFEMGIIALNMKGEGGASGTVTSYTDQVKPGNHYAGFPYAYWKHPDHDVKIHVFSQ